MVNQFDRNDCYYIALGDDKIVFFLRLSCQLIKNQMEKIMPDTGG